MRRLAVIANLAQLGVVLILFFYFGSNPNSWIGPALFGLLLAALLNLVVLLFYASNKAIHHPLFGAGKEPSKRQDFRVSYSTAPYPTVIINDIPFNVLDLSENGIRFNCDRLDHLPKKLKGRVTLLSGRAISFQGNLIRRTRDQAAIKFALPIDNEFLVKESHLVRSTKP